jgi:hypothetical protein
MQSPERIQKFLDDIAKLISDFENVEGYGCANNVGCLLSILDNDIDTATDDTNRYEFNGETMDKLPADIFFVKDSYNNN